MSEPIVHHIPLPEFARGVVDLARKQMLTEAEQQRIGEIQQRVRLAQKVWGERFDEPNNVGEDRVPLSILRDQDRAWLLALVQRLTQQEA